MTWGLFGSWFTTFISFNETELHLKSAKTHAKFNSLQTVVSLTFHVNTEVLTTGVLEASDIERP